MLLLWTYRDGVVAVGEDVEQVGGGDEVEPGESEALRLQVLGQSLLTQRQLVLQTVQPLIQLGLVGGLHHVLRPLHVLHDLLGTDSQVSEVCISGCVL